MKENPEHKVRRSQEARVAETLDTVYQAILTSLDEHGFSATTFSTVQQLSGLSRGALTYHFSTKVQMIEFACRRLLDAANLPTQARGRKRAQASGDITDFLMFYWRQVMNTREGRAFIEIVVASRTDTELDVALGPYLQSWDEKVCKSVPSRFVAASGSDEDAAMMWSMSRTFLRGLIIQSRFVSDPRYLEAMVYQYGQMLAEELKLRGTQNERQFKG